MPRNGNGTYTLAVNPIGVTGQVISLANFTSEFNDLATAMTGSIAANGETTITGTLKGFASSSPCYAFSGDLTSGFGSPGAGTYNLAASGTNVISYTPTGVTITGTMSISGALTLTAGFTSTVTTTGSTVAFLGFEAISTEAAAAAGPIISVYRNSASPATSDFLGAYDFYGQNTTPAKKLYSRIVSQITDATAASEDADLLLQTIVAGTLTTIVTGTTAGIKVLANPVCTPGKAPTYQTFTTGSAATYTTATGAVWLRVKFWGGGGGGGGTGTSGGTGGGTGGTTTFNSINSIGGTGGGVSNGSPGAAGAGGTGGTGSTNVVLRIDGSKGSPGGNPTTAVSGTSNPGIGSPGAGAYGLPGMFGGTGGIGTSSGVTAIGGGGGGGTPEYVELIISSPAASYVYTVGAAGTLGTAGASGNAGLAGSVGRIIVEEYYS